MIRFEGVPYTELPEGPAKEKVRLLALRLWPLQDDISRWPSGSINLAVGGLAIEGFSSDMETRIRILIHKR